MSWAAEEFKGVDLGDERLNERAVLLAERLGSQPTESIPNACHGWAETQAAYRFLRNPKADWQALLAGHWEATAERMRAHAVVLNIQDTMELDFNGRQTRGLGPLNYESQRGMYLHPTYAVSPAREPLGIVDAWMWAREPKGADGTRAGLKESRRWIEGYERVAERALELPQTRQVYVADREACQDPAGCAWRCCGMPGALGCTLSCALVFRWIAMLAFLPAFLRMPLAMLGLLLNTVLHIVPLALLTLLKLALPLAAWRRWLSRVLVRVAESWIAVNEALFGLFTRMRWQFSGLDGLSRDKRYLVLANHQSWVDIPVLQKAFNRRIPFMRFFLKRQLIWVPLLGPAWWALDFPFMQRYSREMLLRHPELQGRDRETTRRACAKFRHVPVAMMNFVEGTRFTPVKHAAQSSPYRHLLRPRAGALAYVLDAMGDVLDAVLDVTIVYPRGRPTMLDLIAGRVREVRMDVCELPIAPGLIGAGEEDPAFRGRVKRFLAERWEVKNALIERMLDAAKGER